MGRKAENIVGRRFGRLVVKGRAGRVGNSAAWECQCDCGEIRVITGSNLRRCTSSCGCYALEVRTKHGFHKHPLYFCWINMNRRCGNSDYGPNYQKVKVYKAWTNTPKQFIEYVERVLGPKPSPRHSIDRINTRGHYVPGNLRWATKSEQSNNRRSVRQFTYKGETGTVRYFSDKYGVNFATLRTRLHKGMSICQALETSLNQRASASAKLRHHSGRGRNKTV